MKSRDSKDPARIREMFDSLVGPYDRLNRLLSFGCDRRWRAALASMCITTGSEKALDLCCGTGEMTVALAEKMNSSGEIHAIDISSAMIERMREKISKLSPAPAITIAAGDATRTGFDGRAFDVVTAAFGLRNLPDRAAALAEMAGLLKPGGRLGILEFTRLADVPLPARLFIKRIVPLAGFALSRRADNPYRYLAESIAEFPGAEELRRDLCAVGLKNVQYRLNRTGVVALHVGHKP